MGEDYTTKGDLYIMSTDTGEVAKLGKAINVEMVASDTSQEKQELNLSDDKEMTLSFDITELSDELKELLMPNYVVAQGSLQQIAAILVIMREAGIEIINTHLEQARTHRQKRIDKKWAKRYGYTCLIRYKTRGNDNVD